jgi:hypothetical protein
MRLGMAIARPARSAPVDPVRKRIPEHEVDRTGRGGTGAPDATAILGERR